MNVAPIPLHTICSTCGIDCSWHLKVFCFDKTPCGRGEHEEGCETQVFGGDS